MKQSLNYSIHDILKVRISKNKNFNLFKGISHPFSFFEVKEEIENPDIILNIGIFSPSNKNCYIVDHKYHIKENYIYCKDSEGSANWEFEIFGFEEGKTIINFNAKFFGPELLFSDLIPQEMLLMPIIIYKLSRKGYYLIHGGGVSKDNSGYIFAGRGGSSKTELIIDFVKSGYNYLGDDWIIIHKDTVASFPKNFSGFMFSIKTMKLPTESFSTIFDKICYLRYSSKYSNDSDDNVLKVTNFSSLKFLFLIIKSNKKTINVRKIDYKNAIDRLIANNRLEMIINPNLIGKVFGRYHNYMLGYSFIFPNSKISTYFEDSKNGMKDILKYTYIYEIKVPRNYSPEIHKRIISLIEC